MSTKTILYSKEGLIGTIRLNRPERMNAVIEEMYEEIRDVLEQAGRDDEVRVLILTGSVLRKGDTVKQAFCAGADLKKHSAGDRTPEEKRAYILLAHETCRRIYTFAKPVIAAVNGPARGAGTEMAMNCDFIFMAEEATLAFPETSLGTFVGGGVTFHLPRMVGLVRAKELIYTNRVMDGRAAVEAGLALRCFPADRLMDETRAFAAQLAEKAPLSMRLAKRLLQPEAWLDMAAVLEREAEAILACMETEDWLEGVRAFGEKRKPRYRGR
jgi:enoyl-CoA hydratase